MSDSHQSCRRKVCVICSRKATRKFNLSQTDVKSVKNFVDKDYNYDDPEYPTGISNGCYLLLNKKRNGHNIIIPINQTYKSANIPKFLRSVGSSCQCSICNIAHSNINEIIASKKKRGRPKSTNPNKTNPEPGTTVKVCATCFTKIYPGCRH